MKGGEFVDRLQLPLSQEGLCPMKLVNNSIKITLIRHPTPYRIAFNRIFCIESHICGGFFNK
jgi:hypothetical protein